MGAGLIVHVANAEVLPSQPIRNIPAKQFLSLDLDAGPAPGPSRGSRQAIFDA